VVKELVAVALNSPGQRFGVEEGKLRVGKNEVEDGEGVGAFYRPRDGRRRADSKRLVAQWSINGEPLRQGMQWGMADF
jgi:hypothetical protein